MKKFRLIAISKSICIECLLNEKELFRQLKKLHSLHISFSKINKNEGKLDVSIFRHNINAGPNVATVPGESWDGLQQAAFDSNGLQTH